MKKTMFLLLTVIGVMVIGYNPKPAFGDDAGSDNALCEISITVDSIVEWEANFPDIALAAIEAQASEPNGSATQTLWTNSHVDLSSDQTVASQLYHNRGGGATEDTLVTSYMISTDEAGVTQTGATTGAVSASGSDAWVEYDDFLETALAITHFNTDGAVEVTLYVKAANDTHNVADTGLYEAVQTITAAWVGPDN